MNVVLQLMASGSHGANGARAMYRAGAARACACGNAMGHILAANRVTGLNRKRKPATSTNVQVSILNRHLDRNTHGKTCVLLLGFFLNYYIHVFN